MSDQSRERIERWAGDRFVNWYNDARRSTYRFAGHSPPPDADLLYSDGSTKLHVEVTGSFYDQDAAPFEGMNARLRSDAPMGWSSLKENGSIVAMDDGLCEFLNQQLLKKSGKSSTHTSVLVIYHVSRLLHREEIETILDQIAVPETHPFSAIYFLADLPDGQAQGALVIRQLA